MKTLNDNIKKGEYQKYLTGYLTQVKEEDVGSKLDDSKMTALTIPNKEIKDIFETTVIKWQRVRI